MLSMIMNEDNEFTSPKGIKSKENSILSSYKVRDKNSASRLKSPINKITTHNKPAFETINNRVQNHESIIFPSLVASSALNSPKSNKLGSLSPVNELLKIM